MQMYFKDLWWSFLLIALGSYFIGNINFAVIISRSKNKDIRNMGSGNPGTLNMSRQFGLKFGVLTLILDILKGAVPTLVATLVYREMTFGDSHLAVSEMAQYLAGFFAVLGHIFPAIYKFKGGKGIATTIGVFLVTEPIVTLIFAIIAIIYILVKEIGSIGSARRGCGYQTLLRRFCKRTKLRIRFNIFRGCRLACSGHNSFNLACAQKKHNPLARGRRTSDRLDESHPRYENKKQSQTRG